MKPLPYARLSEADIRNHVGSRAFEAGSAYWRQRRVVGFDEVDGKIEARVQGSQREPYRVEIKLSPPGGHGVAFHSSCSCPVGSYCKHAAAALLEMRARDARGGVAVGRDERPTRPGIAKSAAAPPADPGLPAPLVYWLDALQKAQSDDGDDYPKDVLQRIVYVFRIQTYPRGAPVLGVELLSTRRLKDGSFSASFSRPSLTSLMTDAPARYLRPADLAFARKLFAFTYPSHFGGDYKLSGEWAWALIDEALAMGRARFGAVNGPTLRAGTTRAGKIAWRLVGDADLLPAIEAEDGSETFAASPPGYFDRHSGEIGRLDVGLSPKLAEAVLRAPAAPIRYAQALGEAMEQRAPLAAVARPTPAEPTLKLEGPPQPVLRLFKAELPPVLSQISPWRHAYDDHGRQAPKEPVALARLIFQYGPIRIAPAEKPEVVVKFVDGRLVEVRRDLEVERRARERLAEAGFVEATLARPGVPAAHAHDLLPEEDDLGWFDVLYQVLPRLRENGFAVEIAEDFPYRLIFGESKTDAAIRQSSGVDWFELDLGVTIDGERFDLVEPISRLLAEPDFDPSSLSALDDEDPIYLRLADGRNLALPASRLAPIIEAIYELSCASALINDKGALRLTAGDAAALAEFEQATLSAGIVWQGGEQLREMGRKLGALGRIPSVTPPVGFTAQLRPYQAEGLNWLAFLRDVGLGGILADDMGLGKTVQALGLIALEKAEGRLETPALVVAPTSLMANWRAEAEKFTPDLRVLTLHGHDRKARFDAIATSDIVLTTYPLIGRDTEVFASRRWSLLILDEAQTIKNPDAATTRIIRKIEADHRFALTGTPLENHLGELWSLFSVVSPGFLGDRSWFSHAFRTPIEKKGDKERAHRLARRVKPFLLRRTKDEVARELPPKSEIVERIEMAREQRDLYESIRLTMHEKVRAAIAAKGLGRSQIVVLEALLRLRQVCCDPRLLKLSGKSAAKAGSAKLERLEEMLPELVAEGRRPLVFSQFTSMLDLIRPRLDALGLSYSLLTGETKDRPEQIRAFQGGKTDLFLISLKAGGVGLNLTAADTVILYDPWWNPAVEAQAIDRAHRIGQDKPVFVHKLTMSDTIEEKMETLKAKKQAIAQSLFDDEGAPTLAMTEDDIEALFAAE